MASVKKFPGCRVWYACYKKFTGTFNESGRPQFKRVQQTTMLTDRSEAMRVALAFESQSVRAAAGQWNKANARALSHEIQAITGSGPAQVETAEKFVREWLDLFKADREKAHKTKRNYESVVMQFLEFLGPKAARPVGDFTSGLIVEFREAQRKAGKSTSTINKALGVVRQICDRAISVGALAEHPFHLHGMNLTLPRGAKDKRKRKPFTFEQFRQLVDACGPNKRFGDGGVLEPEWQTFVMVCGYTGGRQQEPAKLRWNQIDLKEGRLWMDVTKGKKEHHQPIHPALLAHLKKLKGRTPDGYVMPTIARQSGQALSKKFREVILPRIGIIQEYHTRAENPEKGEGRAVAVFPVQAVRRVAGSTPRCLDRARSDSGPRGQVA